MNWTDILCGEQVDPRHWEGGIIADSEGRWHEVLDIGHSDQLFSIGWGKGIPWEGTTPIFPRRSWAGKTDVELWEAVFGDAWKGPDFSVGNWKWACRVNWGRPPELYLAACTLIHDSEFAPATSALGNAQVLATRLKEAQHGTDQR